MSEFEEKLREFRPCTFEEYEWLMCHVYRFLKENGLYCQFIEITIKYYGGKYAHYIEIRGFIDNQPSISFLDFFKYVPFLGEEYSRFSSLFHPWCTLGHNFFVNVIGKWREWVISHNVVDKFLEYRKNNEGAF